MREPEKQKETEAPCEEAGGRAPGQKLTGACAAETEQGWVGAAGVSPSSVPPAPSTWGFQDPLQPRTSWPCPMFFPWLGMPFLSHPLADSVEVTPPPGSLSSPHLMLTHITQYIQGTQAFVPELILQDRPPQGHPMPPPPCCVAAGN